MRVTVGSASRAPPRPERNVRVTGPPPRADGPVERRCRITDAREGLGPNHMDRALLAM
jgi:hypothetical protein